MTPPSPPLPSADSHAPSVCISVPCYNEASRLPADAFIAYIVRVPNVHFCFIDDGSADHTQQVLTQLRAQQPDRIDTLILPRNLGKAGAVRAGMLHSAARSFDYLGFLDADLATPLDAIADLTNALHQNPALDLVMGSRIKHLGADIRRNEFRHYTGRVLATFISTILKLPVYDTQCGAKLFRSRAVSTLFDREFISPWLFDVELLARLVQQRGRANVLDHVCEYPLRAWTEKSDSRISPGYAFKVWADLYRINQTYKE